MAAAQGIVGGSVRRRALTSRVSTGHVVMVVAGLLGALLTMSALRAANDTSPVLVAARDIVPGTVIDSRSFRASNVHADAGVLATLFDASSIDAVRGQIAIVRIPAGSLVTHDDITEVAAGEAPRAMSFPIPVTRAVGGSLVAGDHVDVLSVQHNTGRAKFVATDATVLAFSSRGSGALQGSDDATITLEVESVVAARIASALETGSVTLVRATGAAQR